jgi:hypothetical protein
LPQTKIHFAFFGPGGAGEGHDILTDNNGDASIPEPDDPGKKGGPNVFVTAEGHVPKVVGFRNGPVPGDYTMRLEPAMTAGGLVVDEQGLPVAGVTILVQGPGNKPGQMENVDFQTCPVTNREDGSWSCSYIPKDCTEIWLILKKPGYAVTFPVVPVAEADLTNLVLVIDRGSIITGHVTDQQGQPVGNASVRVLNGVRSKRQSTRTDEAGNFMLSGISGEQLYQPPLETNSAGQVVIRGLGLPPTLHTAKSLRRNESPNDLARQKVLLERLKKLPKEEQAQAIVSGGVQDLFLPSLLEQLALHQRELKQLNEQFGPQHSAVQEVSTLLADLQQKVDARAQGVLSGLEAKLASLEEPRPPHVDLAVQAKGFAAHMAIVDLLSATNVINLSLAPGNIFRGRVVDEAGNPIPGAVIRTDFDFKNQIETRFEWTGHTDVNGRFEWDSAPAEDICYWFEAAGYEVLRGVPLLADSSDHEILLKSRVAK